MRRKGHPSRPRAMTCCFFASLKTLLIPTKATALRRNQRPRALFSLAGFEVTLIGRFWVTPEGGATGSECNRVGIRGRRTRSTTVPSADDGQDLDVWVLCGSVFLAADTEETEGGYRVSGVGSGEPTGFPNDLGVSEAASS